MRYADQADNDMDRALEKLNQMAEIYQEEHPQYALACEAIGKMIIMAQANLKEFRNNHM